MTTPFSIIVAVDKDFGIGKAGLLPWDLPGEIKHFKDVTTADYDGHQNAVIMGRKTWDSIPSKFRPLPKRLNVVLTRQNTAVFASGVLSAASLDEALHLVSIVPCGKVFVIGGAELFKKAIDHPLCHEIYLTHIQSSFDCDCFFPPLPTGFREASRSELISEKGSIYSFILYKR